LTFESSAHNFVFSNWPSSGTKTKYAAALYSKRLCTSAEVQASQKLGSGRESLRSQVINIQDMTIVILRDIMRLNILGTCEVTSVRHTQLSPHRKRLVL